MRLLGRKGSKEWLEPESIRPRWQRVWSALNITTASVVLLVGLSMASVGVPSHLVVTRSLTRAREDQLRGAAANAADEILAHMQVTTRSARFFSEFYSIAYASAPAAAPQYYLENFGSSTWSILNRVSTLSSLLFAQARDPSLVNPEDPECNVDGILLSASYKADLHHYTSGTGLSFTPPGRTDAAKRGHSKANYIQGKENFTNPLAISGTMFEKPCTSWLGGGESLWATQNLPGSWQHRDSAVREPTWLSGVVIVGTYPKEALYKKLSFNITGPPWAPLSSFGALSMRVGSSFPERAGAFHQTSLNTILQQVAGRSDMETILFIMTGEAELLASSLPEQPVEKRVVSEGFEKGRLVGLARCDDDQVRSPIRPIAKTLIEEHCQNLASGKTSCQWPPGKTSIRIIEDYFVATVHVTDPLAQGLSILLINMVQESEVLQPVHDLNRKLAVIIPVSFCVVAGIALLLARAITRPLQAARDSMLMLAHMKLEEGLEHLLKYRCCFCNYSEVRDLKSSFIRAAKKLELWQQGEIDRRAQLEVDSKFRVKRLVQEAAAGANKLAHPIVLIRATNFLQLQEFRSYESLRDEGLLVFLDTEKKLDAFRKDAMIVFLSHQWLAWGIPDPQNVHIKAMKHAVWQVLQRSPLQRELHVWVDYCSIAQEHRGMQMLAVSSLPAYASNSDAFVIIAPPAQHQSSCQSSCHVCDLDTYQSRGWCRLEMLAKICSSGLENFFIMTSLDGPLQEVTEQQLRSLPLYVFEGDFSCCQRKHINSAGCDKESLVQVLLGLYALLLHRRKSLRGMEFDHLSVVDRFIRESKDRFFPECFEYALPDGTIEKRDLFGASVMEMEKYIKSADQSTIVKSDTFFRSPSRTLSLTPTKSAVDRSIMIADFDELVLEMESYELHSCAE